MESMADDQEVLARYSRRAGRFADVISAAPPGRWSAQSPCATWTAADVVQHAVDMHAAMFVPTDLARAPGPSVTEDPLGAFNSARADVERALGDPAVAGLAVQTPMGPSTFAAHVDGVASADLMIHSWDLARALGLDYSIDPDELDDQWQGAQQIPDIMRRPGAFGPGIVVFGPVVEVPDDAPVQDRILGLLGRDPHWT
ncbi:TIGR03086 family metal-binding protein [Williamsia sp. 1135]|uniref:TIGR03086 family metal-binding protein n=1 Tax=Williamsia sp. 1135 TaxID=1889262 RepID=UPI000A0F502F|nr:TIGR03086 family metal-binding protein [Williamsia sp. 1135]ORM31888.1 TIGR03086 family protein [Williamsia sp. 1135]